MFTCLSIAVKKKLRMNLLQNSKQTKVLQMQFLYLKTDLWADSHTRQEKFGRILNLRVIQ